MTWFAHCVPVVRIFFRFFSSSSLLFDFYSLFPFSFSSSFSCASFCHLYCSKRYTRLLLSPSKRGQTRFGSVARRRPRERRSTTLTGICDVTAVSSRNAIIRCVCVQAEYRNTFTGVGEISYSIFCQ